MHFITAENDSAMHTVHHDLAILFMPDGEPKALLSKAGMHVEVGNYEDACAIYREMYANVDDTETKYQPYVINNYGKSPTHHSPITFVHGRLRGDQFMFLPCLQFMLRVCSLSLECFLQLRATHSTVWIFGIGKWPPSN